MREFLKGEMCFLNILLENFESLCYVEKVDSGFRKPPTQKNSNTSGKKRLAIAIDDTAENIKQFLEKARSWISSSQT